MLYGISPLVSPELLDLMCRMGHGDELVLADCDFPGTSLAKRIVRADGLLIAPLLQAILPLFPLDRYVPTPVWMMQPVPGDTLDPAVEDAYRAPIDQYWPGTPAVGRLERFAFYERAQQAFGIVQTSETARYGNVILIKGNCAPGAQPRGQ